LENFAVFIMDEIRYFFLRSW